MIYLHIPFCKQKCSYCNFHFSTNTAYIDRFLDALHTEIVVRKAEFAGKTVSSVYFGGGTPSLLSATQIQTILDLIQEHYSLAEQPEITLEANPDDLHPSYLASLQDVTEVNRLSIGLQSFNEEELIMMHRAHSAAQSYQCIEAAQKYGFSNISIDLIYGSTLNSEKVWDDNLQKSLALGIQHVSAYALTVEPKTLLQHQIKKGIHRHPDEHLQHRQYRKLCETLHMHGFEHYEISNFALPGFYSRHNRGYWQGKAYLGFGPSAHSFDGERRRCWNVANNQQYLQQMADGVLPQECEVLQESERYNEYLMIGLRTSTGISLSHLEKVCPPTHYSAMQRTLKKLLENGEIVQEGDWLRIPEERWFFADGIAAELFNV